MTHNPPEAATHITFAARAERYARAVLTGEVVAGKYVRAAAQRHLDDLARSANDPAWSYTFDAERAGRPCHFLQCLPHIKGEWARLRMIDGVLTRPRITLQDWQVFLVAVMFGWVHRETRLRRFRRVYFEVARKNAKSTLCAGLALYLMAADDEPGAEVYSAATKEEQARIVWNDAVEMIRLEPEFRAMPPYGLGCDSTTQSVFRRDTASKYRPLGRDSKSQDGLNVHGFIADELHAWKDRGLYDVLDSATGARSQPLGIAITTAGYNTLGVCYEQRAYLIRVLNSTLLAHGGMGYRVDGDALADDTVFGLIYTLDTGYADDGREDDKWADEENWIKANPNLGVSVSLEDLRAKRDKAVASPQSQPEFRTKACNQWLAAESSWMDMAKWDACTDRSLTPEQFAGEPAYVALDAAFRTDVFAKVKVFRRDEHYYAFGSYWLPETKADPKEHPEMYGFAQDGHLNLSPGPVLDIELVRESLRADRDLHDVREVPYDPAHLSQFSAEMMEEGAPMIELRPLVLNFSEPMKRIADLVLEGKFHHNGDPVLRWMISNVVCHRDAKDNIYPRKPENQEQRKIDGVIALIMAIARAMVQAAPKRSVYEDRGVLEL